MPCPTRHLISRWILGACCAIGCAHSGAPSRIGQSIRVAGPDGEVFAPLGLPALRERAWVAGEEIYDCIGPESHPGGTPLGALELRLTFGGERSRVDLVQTSTSWPDGFRRCVEGVLGGIEWNTTPVQVPLFIDGW